MRRQLRKPEEAVLTVGSNSHWRGRAKIFCLALALSAPFLFSFSGESDGQSLPSIEAPQLLRLEAGREQGLAIRVVPENAVSNQTMLLIRGLPSSVALSAGRLFESGIWGVKPQDLPELKILTAPNAAGQQFLSLSLVSFDGTVLAERHFTIMFEPPGTTAPIAEAVQESPLKNTSTDDPAPLPPQNEPPQPKQLTEAEIDQLLLLMKRGDENMADGKINIARLFYQRAAEGGWAPGALALGKTYDAEELARLPVLGGIKAEPQEAQKWYAAARRLGSQEADERLQRYGQR